jgi:hypothetical protein
MKSVKQNDSVSVLIAVVVDDRKVKSFHSSCS